MFEGDLEHLPPTQQGDHSGGRMCVCVCVCVCLCMSECGGTVSCIHTCSILQRIECIIYIYSKSIF